MAKLKNPGQKKVISVSEYLNFILAEIMDVFNWFLVIQTNTEWFDQEITHIKKQKQGTSLMKCETMMWI